MPVGVKNLRNEWVIPPEYKFVTRFCQGIAGATPIDSIYSYIIDRRNQIVGPDQQFLSFPQFAGRVGVVIGANEKYGIINTLGEFIVEPSYALIMPFSCGLAVAKKNEDDEKYQVLNEAGKIILDDVGSGQFGLGYGKFLGESSVFNLVGAKVQKPLPALYEKGVHVVRRGKYSGLQNFKGEWIVSPEFKNLIASRRSPGIYIATRDDGLKNVIDISGSVMLSNWYEDLFFAGPLETTSTYLKFVQDEKYGLMDLFENILIPAEYEYLGVVCEGLIRTDVIEQPSKSFPSPKAVENPKMEIEKYESGDHDVRLGVWINSYDEINLIPKSHAYLLSDDLKTAFQNPKAHLSLLAQRCHFPEMKRWLETMVDTGVCALVLHSDSIGTRASLFWQSTEVYPAYLEVPAKRIPSFYPTALRELFSLASHVYWQDFGAAGGMGMSEFGVEDLRPEGWYQFGEDLGGNLLLFNEDQNVDEAGWCCIGDPEVDKVETLHQTIDNIFEKMNRRVMPGYGTR